MRKFISVLMIASAGLVGCSDDDSSAVAPVSPPIQPKPLPPCEEMVTAELQSETTPLARKRHVKLGFSPNTYFFQADLYEGETRPGLQLPRGYTYYVTVNTEKLDRSWEYYGGSFYVPKCEEREEYQQRHPEYEEPIPLVELKN